MRVIGLISLTPLCFGSTFFLSNGDNASPKITPRFWDYRRFVGMWPSGRKKGPDIPVSETQRHLEQKASMVTKSIAELPSTEQREMYNTNKLVTQPDKAIAQSYLLDANRQNAVGLLNNGIPTALESKQGRNGLRPESVERDFSSYMAVGMAKGALPPIPLKAQTSRPSPSASRALSLHEAAAPELDSPVRVYGDVVNDDRRRSLIYTHSEDSGVALGGQSRTRSRKRRTARTDNGQPGQHDTSIDKAGSSKKPYGGKRMSPPQFSAQFQEPSSLNTAKLTSARRFQRSNGGIQADVDAPEASLVRAQATYPHVIDPVVNEQSRGFKAPASSAIPLVQDDTVNRANKFEVSELNDPVHDEDDDEEANWTVAKRDADRRRTLELLTENERIEVRDFAPATKPQPQAVTNDTNFWECLPSPEAMSESTQRPKSTPAVMYADNCSTDRITPAPAQWPLIKQNPASLVGRKSTDKLSGRRHREFTDEDVDLIRRIEDQEKQGPQKQSKQLFHARNPLSPFAKVVPLEFIGVGEGHETLPKTNVQPQHRKPVAPTKGWQHALKTVARFLVCTT